MSLARPLSTKELEVLIVLWAYTDEGSESATVRELQEAMRENHENNEDDWSWHDWSVASLRTQLLFLNSNDLVERTSERVPRWSLTARGKAFFATSDESVRQRILGEGHMRYLAATYPASASATLSPPQKVSRPGSLVSTSGPADELTRG